MKNVMKKILFITLVFFLSYSTYAQELAADDFVVITQENEAYPGFQAKTYRGLFSVGHGQFKMFNYGGTPGNLSALGADETLGSFVFNGYDGSSNVISAVIQAKTITDSRDVRFNFLLSNGVGSQRPNRLTIIGQTGFVGIGASSPTEKLDVAGRIRMRTGANAGYIPVSDADGKMTWTDPSTILTPSPWETSGSDVYRADGELGLGGVPLARFHIRQDDTNINDGIRMSSVNTGQDMYMYMDTVDNFVFRDDGVDMLTLENGTQNIGIGENDPTARLHIEGKTSSTENVITATVNNTGTGIDMRGVNATSVPGDGYGYGVYGAGGYKGVYGRGNGGAYTGGAMGIQGYAVGTTGTRYGVYGSASGGTTNYGGYFSGDVNVTGTFSNPSDRKLKQNIESYTDALKVIQQLETKTYDYKKGEFAGMGLPSQPQIGFIAQEVEKVLPNLVTANVHPEEVEHDEAGKRIIVREAIDYKAINYIGLVPVLTQGIKELSTQNEELITDNVELKSEVADLTQKMDKMAAMLENMNDKFNQMEEDMSSCCLSETGNRTGSVNTNVELNGSDVPSLEQNNPNPFYEQTVIKYYIPSAAKNARMTITDMKGSPIKSVNLAGTGLGTVTINANELPIGTYVYTLYVDGKQVESKQMILVK
jgi:hypothetical protein